MPRRDPRYERGRLRLPRVPAGLDPTLSSYLDALTRGIQDTQLEFALAARVWRSTNQTVNAGTVGAVAFDTSVYDTAGFWSSGTASRFTARTSGVYLVHFMSNADSGTYDAIYFRTNGSTRLNPGPTNARPEMYTKWDANLGDYIEVIVDADGGTALVVQSASTYSPVFEITYAGPRAE